MKKNFYLDMILLVGMVICGITGIMLDFHMFGGMGRDGKMIISNIHTWIGYLLLIGIVIHLIWHWKWVKAMAKKQIGK